MQQFEIIMSLILIIVGTTHYFSYFFQISYKYRYRYYMFILMMVVVCYLLSANFRWIEYEILATCLPLVIYLTCYKHRHKERLTYLGVYYGVCVFAKLYALAMVVLIYSKGNVNLDVFMEMLEMMYGFFCFILLYVIVLHARQKEYNISTVSAKLNIVLFIAYFIVFIRLMFILEDLNLHLIDYGLLFGINILILFIIDRLIKVDIENQKLFYLGIIEEHSALLEQKYSRSQSYLHDIKNHLACIGGLTQLGDLERIKEYLKKIDVDQLKHHHHMYTNHRILDIILNIKKHIAEKEGIEFYIFCDEVPLEFLNDVDICTIFGNIIDNAVEHAVATVESYINLDIYHENAGDIIIKVENSCLVAPNISNGKLKTHKKDKDRHGKGLQNVQRALNLYGGKLFIDYKEQEQRFQTIIVLPKVKEKDDTWVERRAYRIES